MIGVLTRMKIGRESPCLGGTAPHGIRILPITPDPRHLRRVEAPAFGVAVQLAVATACAGKGDLAAAYCATGEVRCQWRP